MARAERRVLVLAVGNALRGDDGAAPAVAEALRAEGADVLATDGEPAGLVEALGRAEAALILDAASSGAPPGTIHRFEPAAGPLPAAFATASTHALGVPEAVELARALGALPARVVVLGIEGKVFAHGAGLSEEVRAALPAFREAALAEIARLGRPEKEDARRA